MRALWNAPQTVAPLPPVSWADVALNGLAWLAMVGAATFVALVLLGAIG